MQTRSLSARAKLAGYKLASEALLSHSFSLPFAVFSPSVLVTQLISWTYRQLPTHRLTGTPELSMDTVRTVHYIHCIIQPIFDKWKKCQSFSGSIFSNMRICCLNIVKFDLLVGQNKPLYKSPWAIFMWFSEFIQTNQSKR